MTVTTNNVASVTALAAMDSAEHNAMMQDAVEALVAGAASGAASANETCTLAYRLFLANPESNESLLVSFIAGIHDAASGMGKGLAKDNMTGIVKAFKRFMRWSHGSDISASKVTDATYMHRIAEIPKVGECTVESVMTCFEERPTVETPDVAHLIETMVLNAENAEEAQPLKGRDAKARRLAQYIMDKGDEADGEKILDMLESLNTPTKTKGKTIRVESRGSLFAEALSRAEAKRGDAENTEESRNAA